MKSTACYQDPAPLFRRGLPRSTVEAVSELEIERDAAAANGAAIGSASEVAAVPVVAGERVDLEDSWLYFNRELSWMDFNDRVLQLAEDTSLPLLERLKFCAIYESNLDEFYMVRVAGVHDKIVASLAAGGADGIPPVEVLAALRERAIAQRARIERTLADEVLPALAERGIRILNYPDATAEELDEQVAVHEGGGRQTGPDPPLATHAVPGD